MLCVVVYLLKIECKYPFLARLISQKDIRYLALLMHNQNTKHKFYEHNKNNLFSNIFIVHVVTQNASVSVLMRLCNGVHLICLSGLSALYCHLSLF